LYKYGGIYIDCKTQLEKMDNKITQTNYQNFFIATEKEGKIISAIR
jgi:mannosyltransferase OCH1-like enzyme